MRTTSSGRRRGARCLAVALAVLPLMSSCVPDPVALPAQPPTVDRWSAGDSISVGWSAYYATTPTYVSGFGGAKFVNPSGPTIESSTVAEMNPNDKPATIIVNGGVNNWAEPTATVIAAMAHFESTMTTKGIDVTWVTEPAYPRGFATQMAPINAWVRSRPGHIDCNDEVVPFGSYDDVHPTADGYKALAACVEAST